MQLNVPADGQPGRGGRALKMLRVDAGGVDSARRPEPGGFGWCEPFGGGHLPDDRVGAGPQEPAEFTERGFEVPDVFEHVAAPDQVGAGIWA
jgi:hypothetical protein